MNPLFIIFLQLGIGGVQRKIVDIANFLASYQPNLPVYILLRNRTNFDLGSEIKNKNVQIINYATWNKFKIRYFFPFFVLYYVWRLKPSSILAFLDFCSLPAVIAKYVFFWRKMKVVLSEDHYASKVISTWKLSSLRHFLIKIFYPFADAIFSCSQAAKQDLIDYYRLPSNKIKIIYNWTTLLEQKKTRKAYKQYDFIYVGRWEKTKNLKFIIKAVNQLKKRRKKITSLFLGEGKEEKKLKKMRKDLGLSKNIIFMSSKHKVKRFLAQAKIFVYCSWAKVEGLPLAILEAMAVGVPILTREFAGAREFLKNGKNCYLFKTEKEFLEKALWLLNSPQERRKISIQASQYLKKYHSPENIKTYLRELNL